MAARYGLLPSKILKEASTVDLFVFDAAATAREHMEKKARGDKSVDMPEKVLLEKMQEYNKKYGTS